MRRHQNEEQERQEKRVMDTLSTAFILELRNLVQTERDATMMTMPADRVVRALKRKIVRQSEEMWLGDLVSWFRPIVALGMVVILTLVMYNFNLLSSNNELQQSVTEMVFGLPPITVASAYDISLEDHP